MVSLCLGVLARGAAASTSFHLDPSALEPSPIRLAIGPVALVRHLDLVTEAPPDPRPSPPAPKVLDRKTILASGAILVAVPVLGYFTWWSDEEGRPFHVQREQWFGSDTYTGGADKASHIVFGYWGTLAGQSVYRSLGKTPAEARALASTISILAGTIIETGDGLTTYGFSWEDLSCDILGVGLATAIDAWGLHDTLGMRAGPTPAPIPPPCCRFGGFGRDYSSQLYTLDLKLAGFLPRLGAKKPGIGRYLLLSLTYGSKGYRFSPEESRERNVGLEIGLNLPEILRAAGVRDTSWWGRQLLAILTFVRLPFTAVGIRYELNHSRWHGPEIQPSYDPGFILYE